ncbi:hypothetical protein ACO0RG_002871 [Hanseniaspora osmophila]
MNDGDSILKKDNSGSAISTRRKLFASLFGGSRMSTGANKGGSSSTSGKGSTGSTNTSKGNTATTKITETSTNRRSHKQLTPINTTRPEGKEKDKRHQMKRTNSASSTKSISIGQLQGTTYKGFTSNTSGISNASGTSTTDYTSYNSDIDYRSDSNTSYSNSTFNYADSMEEGSSLIKSKGSRSVSEKESLPQDVKLAKLTPISFKRVKFQVDKFGLDPPQQIPSRKPKVCSLLLPYELISPIDIDAGISVTTATPNPTQTGTPNSTSSASGNKLTKDSREYKILLDQYNASLNDSMKFQQESYFRAKKIEEELKKLNAPTSVPKPATTITPNSTPKKPQVQAPKTLASTIKSVLPQGTPVQRDNKSNPTTPTTPTTTSTTPTATPHLGTGPTTPVTPVSASSMPEMETRHSEENIIIDKPIHRHHSFVDELPTQVQTPEEPSAGNNAGEVVDTATKQEEDSLLTLDKVYTRCCHLREILPIPITLKQLKRKSSSPQNRLPVLKFLNPKPTLIDILSFTDFTSIVSNLDSLVFDNVTLNNHMVKIILLSLPKTLHKLSLKNVPLGKENWMILCKYVMTHPDLHTLDISQTKIRTNPITQAQQHDEQHLKPTAGSIGAGSTATKEESYLRVDLDWELFWRVNQQRETPVELIYVNTVTPGAPYSTPPTTNVSPSSNASPNTTTDTLRDSIKL